MTNESTAGILGLVIIVLRAMYFVALYYHNFLIFIPLVIVAFALNQVLRPLVPVKRS